MPRCYSSSKTRCPCYKQESPQCIYCWGIPGSASTHVTFKNKAEYVAYREQYCQHRYDQCPMYRLLIQTPPEESV